MYNTNEVDKPSKNVLHTFKEVNTDSSINTMTMKKVMITFVLAVVVGVGSGFVGAFFTKSATTDSKGTKSDTNTESVNVPKRAGVDDKSTFKDTAVGIMQEGGIEGEGNFHLERPGGESQNVYLTSSTVDLTLYIGKKVKVWGETYSAEKAGWLMDVGLIELAE